ncbi:hypothetical protein KAI12_05455 [Candidatus Bathyarchaeota archaeon]|nr:hypothetical protein [Candidatus Bathyarchaeota archaeon]
MTEKTGNKGSDKAETKSKIEMTLWVLLAAFLIFVGPTYITYLLSNILGAGFGVSMASGFLLFVMGLVLLWHLARKKIVT